MIYDIPSDKIRNHLGEICKDYGLQRIQYSGFLGHLSKNMRDELCLKLGEALGKEPGKIMVQPICGKDAKTVFEIQNEAQSPEGGESEFHDPSEN